MRALSEVRLSTSELKKLYRDQGVEVDEPPLGVEGAAVDEALEGIRADADRVAGKSRDIPQRPGFTDLVENLFDREVRPAGQSSERTNGPIYRYLSALAHGTKWAMNHYATPREGSELASVRPTPECTEMLLFYLGIGLLRVGWAATAQLHWVDLRSVGAEEFLGLGPCNVDYGH